MIHNRSRNWMRVWPLFMALCVGVAMPRPQIAHAGLFTVKPDKERRLGDDAAREIEAQAKIVTGPVADWVSGIGQLLVKESNSEFQYSFKVIDGPEINAFALPGGHIYVFTGIRKVARTDDELAAVLAHEITHAEAHHYAKQYSKASKRGALLGIFSAVVGLPSVAQQALGLADLAMTSRYSRVQESEADRAGLARMARAGFNPQGMVSLLENLSKEDKGGGSLNKWFSDHPQTIKRAQAAREQAMQLRMAQPAPQAALQAAPTTPASMPANAPATGDTASAPR